MLRVVASPATPPEITPAGGLAKGVLFVDRYRLEERIGRGGMGEVWLATDVNLEREVAAKFIHPRLASEPASLSRFLREMKSLAKLEHPNIVRLYASDVDPQPYMIMERVRGATLREIIRVGGRIEPVIAVCYAIQIADGLGAAHRAKLSHRDIKPENVLVSDDGRGHVWILDFGIAQSTEGRRHGEGTDRLGSLGYIPPEMALSKPTDHRGDFYQLGIVLYEMLTGRKPYSDVDESSETEMQAAHAYYAPDPILAIVPKCPEPLWHVVAKLLAKEPHGRYQTADAIIADLRALLRPSAPPQRAIAHVVQRELVRKKLSDRPAQEAAPDQDEPSCETVSGVRMVADTTEPLGPMAIAPSPCAPHEERPVGQRRTLPLAPEFVPPSPASPDSVRPPSVSRDVKPAFRDTVSVPPGLVAAAQAPFPLAAPRVTRRETLREDRDRPRAPSGAAMRVTAVAVVAVVAVTGVVVVRGRMTDERVEPLMPIATSSATSAAPSSSAVEAPSPQPSAAPAASATPAPTAAIKAKPDAGPAPIAVPRTTARPLPAPPRRASNRAFDVQGAEPASRPAPTKKQPTARGRLPFE